MPENEKKQDAIAQSTRVRLARNYADVPFPGRMSRSSPARKTRCKANGTRCAGCAI